MSTFTYETKPRHEIEEANESRFQPWPKGEYQFEIADAAQTVTGPNSKTPGIPMIKLSLTVYNAEGHKRAVFDNLISNFPDRIMSFCDAVGLEYGKPINVDMLKGKAGKVFLKVQPERTYNGQTYDPSNVVHYYVKRGTQATATRAPAAARTSNSLPDGREAPPHDLDDSIGF